MPIVCARPVSALALMLLLGGCESNATSGPFARAKVIERLDETIGGEMGASRTEDPIRGLPGDFLLENDHLRVAILSGRNSMGPGLFGGSLVDADLQWNDARFDGGRGLDQWNELFPLISMNVPYATNSGDPENPDAEAQPTVWVANDGSNGEPAVIRVQSEDEPFLSLLDLLWPLVGMPNMWVTTDYIAAPDVPWLTIKTRVDFAAPDRDVADGEPVAYPTDGLSVIEAGLLEGIVFGDFFLAGGSLDVFAPTIGFDEDGAVFQRNRGGENIFGDPFQFDYIAAVGQGVSYGLLPKAGETYVPLFTSSQTAVVSGFQEGGRAEDDCTDRGAEGVGRPISLLDVDFEVRFCTDEAYTYERYFLIGDGDVGSILDQVLEIRGTPYGTVRGRAIEIGTNQALSEVDVFAYRLDDQDVREPCAFPVSDDEAQPDCPYVQWRTDGSPLDTIADGSFEGRLPVGRWELVAHELGRGDSERGTIVDVTEGSEQDVLVAAPQPGVVRFAIVDETNRRVPAKLTVFRDDDATPSRQPILGDGFIGGRPEWVVFADQGVGEIVLPPGRYYAVASRGVEYEIDRSDPFEITETAAYNLRFQVRRSIDTRGWISADFHVHSAPSHDSGVTLPTRVATMATEGVEFFSSTDHDAITDFAPIIEDLGLASWVQSAVGVETTTVEIGHFLAFPLQADFLGDQGGAMDWTGMTPGEIVDNLREQGRMAGHEPMVFNAHPRDGILGYLDQFGMDPFAGVVGAGGEPGTPVWDPDVFPPDILDLINNLFPDIGIEAQPNRILAEAPLVLDFDAMEMFTGKRFDTHRTSTWPEMVAFRDGVDTSVYSWIERTMAEQDALIAFGDALADDEDVDPTDAAFPLSDNLEGVIDDWFTLLNLGHRITAIGNSDTHGLTSIEAGCPRNFVLSSTDDPVAIDDQEIADAVRDHHVVTSYGPFLQMWARSGGTTAIVGDELVARGEVAIDLEVQAPSWIDVDRVELYENGTLIGEFAVQGDGPNLRFAETVPVTPTRDSWYVAIAMGDGSMAPVCTPVEQPDVPLQEAITGALGDLVIGPFSVGDLLAGIAWPDTYPIHPYAITNPIWVDVDGDGFTPPGLPDWLTGREVPLATE